MTARTIMVQGTASSVGKSLLVTALCRIFARRGLRVAPFKAQNMALNSAVTPDGAEIGRAQFAQAEAARAVPHADMNPILLKPEGTSTSQVVVMGKPIGSMHFGEYHRRKLELREVVGAAIDRLRARYDLVVIEGAGSPAEVNLKDRDLVNMWVAARAEAPVILVTDIERGGALAALVGTLALLEPDERARVGALVVNKFRGDARLFADGVTFLEQRTGIRVAGVIPHLKDARIASEDSLDLRPQGLVTDQSITNPPGLMSDQSITNGSQLVIDQSLINSRRVAIIQLPRLSNFDELEPLQRMPSVRARFVSTVEELESAELIIVPGTKCTAADLAWLRQRGLAGKLVEWAHAGRPLLGICGGYQLMGERILDPDGIESNDADVAGLGLLPIVTRFRRDKVTEQVRMRLADGVPTLAAAGGVEARGYEIHCGRVEVRGGRPFGRVVARGDRSVDEPEGCIVGSVAGTLMHGLFENSAVRAVLGGDAGEGGDPYERLADHFAAALDLDHVQRMIGA
jgi:adenosylcobyric acid synthase